MGSPILLVTNKELIILLLTKSVVHICSFSMTLHL